MLVDVDQQRDEHEGVEKRVLVDVDKQEDVDEHVLIDVNQLVVVEDKHEDVEEHELGDVGQLVVVEDEHEDIEEHELEDVGQKTSPAALVAFSGVVAGPRGTALGGVVANSHGTASVDRLAELCSTTAAAGRVVALRHGALKAAAVGSSKATKIMVVEMRVRDSTRLRGNEPRNPLPSRSR